MRNKTKTEYLVEAYEEAIEGLRAVIRQTEQFKSKSVPAMVAHSLASEYLKEAQALTTQTPPAEEGGGEGCNCPDDVYRDFKEGDLCASCRKRHKHRHQRKGERNERE